MNAATEVTTRAVEVTPSPPTADRLRIRAVTPTTVVLLNQSATALVFFVPMIRTDGDQERATTREKFAALATRWHDETDHLSTTTDIVSHPAYLKIIGMGMHAIPHILADLQAVGGNWFTALESIVDETVATEDCTYDDAVSRWVNWGIRNGYTDVLDQPAETLPEP